MFEIGHILKRIDKKLESVPSCPPLPAATRLLDFWKLPWSKSRTSWLFLDHSTRSRNFNACVKTRLFSKPCQHTPYFISFVLDFVANRTYNARNLIINIYCFFSGWWFAAVLNQAVVLPCLFFLPTPGLPNLLWNSQIVEFDYFKTLWPLMAIFLTYFWNLRKKKTFTTDWLEIWPKFFAPVVLFFFKKILSHQYTSYNT